MRLISCSLLLALLGCATAQPQAEPQSKPEYPGRCDLITVEQQEMPTDQSSDQVALVAKYRFGMPNERRGEPLVFAFQVTRSRAEDLRSHLVANPNVLCRPDEDMHALALPRSERLGAVEPLPASAPAFSVLRSPARSDRQVHMGHTFWEAVDARDALLDGDLKRAQSLARSLRDRDYGTALPEDWKAFVGEMQKHADQLAMAPDLETASTELAMISLTCGNCHWFAKRGPEPRPDVRVIEEPPPGDERLQDRMLRHAIGSEQMWEGLIIPSDRAWHDGTTTFTRAPLEPPRADGMAIDSTMQARIEELRGLARNARVARSHPERATLYGRMIAGCASCHYGRR